jgi:hypothetical protein
MDLAHEHILKLKNSVDRETSASMFNIILQILVRLSAGYFSMIFLLGALWFVSHPIASISGFLSFVGYAAITLTPYQLFSRRKWLVALISLMAGVSGNHFILRDALSGGYEQLVRVIPLVFQLLCIGGFILAVHLSSVTKERTSPQAPGTVHN